jgi:hypothetical protein
MNKLKSTFSKLTPIHHFLVFLIILTILKIANVFMGHLHPVFDDNSREDVGMYQQPANQKKGFRQLPR